MFGPMRRVAVSRPAAPADDGTRSAMITDHHPTELPPRATPASGPHATVPDDGERRVHPLVRLDYAIRTVGHLVVAAIVASIIADRSAPWHVWALLALQGLLWPHVAFLAASRA